MNKSYNEIVKTCKLAAYRQELAGKHCVWKEYWQDTDCEYIALFTDYQTNFFPHTIYKRYE